MLTLEEFNLYNKLEKDIEEFLCQRCREVEDIKLKYGEYNWQRNSDYHECFDYYILNDKNNTMEINFRDYDDDTCFSYSIPFDILFNETFIIDMEKHLKEKLERERLERIAWNQKLKAHNERQALKNIEDEKKLLKELMEKYPDELNK